MAMGSSPFSSATQSPGKTAPPRGPTTPSFWEEDLIYLVTSHIGGFVLNPGLCTPKGPEEGP